ncbi:hypothetical protein BDZ88DRAFT_509760 [Geranomyces variabilis]|nr:hypothetical protein BDZ88DRAFT_509760 [Geranomyces variabilis]KAJ3136510.1 hypothetical protein HDU90_003223 [Geranomyces variabilis]
MQTRPLPQEFHGNRATYQLTSWSQLTIYAQQGAAASPCGAAPPLLVDGGVGLRFTINRSRGDTTFTPAAADMQFALLITLILPTAPAGFLSDMFLICGAHLELRRAVVPPTPRGDYNVLWSRSATAVPASVLAALRQTGDLNQLPTATAAHLFEDAVEVEVNQAVIINCPFWNHVTIIYALL